MSVADPLHAANKALDVGDYKTALSNYNNVPTTDKQYAADVHLKKAKCLAGLKQLAEAVIEAERCTANDPQCIEGYVVQGQCLTELEQFEEAYRAFKKGLELDEQDKAVAHGLRDLQKAIVANYESADKETETNYDALKLCSQEPYPGDDELEVLEKEIMEMWKLFDCPEITPKPCNPDISRSHLVKALQAKADGDLDQALEFVTAALEHNATNFENWKNRIDILYQRKDYREAYRTVNSFPEPARNSATWLLGGKILAALELPLSAERWLRRATQLNTDKDDKEAAILFQKIRVGRLYGPLAMDTNAEVTFTQYGRALCAAKTMTNHEIILTDKPVVLAQTLPTKWIPACSHCGVSMLRPEDTFTAADLKKDELKKAIAQYWPKRKIHPCKSCGKEIYCSVDCRDEAWTMYHRVVCPSVNKSIHKLYKICDDYKTLKSTDGRCWKGWWNASFSPFILVRMWATIACEAQRLAKEAGRPKVTKSDWSIAQAPLRR